MSALQKDFNKAVEHYLAGRFAKAQKLFRKVAKGDERNADARHLLGLIALQTGQPDAAEGHIRQAIVLQPANHVYRGSLGAVLREQGQLEAAIDAYREALERHTDYAIAWQNIGQIQADLHLADAAVESLQKALELNGRDAVAHFCLANVRRDQGDVEAAAGHYESAVEINPGYVEAWNNYGNLLASEGRFPDALKAFEEAIKLRPDDAALLTNLARKQIEAGHLDQASDSYGRALSVDRRHGAALAGLADLTTFLGDDAAAGELYARLEKIEPDSPRTHAALASWHEYAGRRDEAEAAVDRALELDPWHQDANLMKAQIDRRKGDLEAAKRRLEAMENPGDDGQFGFELGRVLDRLGEFDKAFGAFERANADHARSRHAERQDGEGYLAMIDAVRAAARSLPTRIADPVLPEDGLADPIFFVGFPRSGTTLMEQFLDAHEELVSAEELPFLEAAKRHLEGTVGYPEGLAKAKPETIAELRRVYWQAAAAALENPVGERLLVDKLPLNLIHVSLVRMMFPAAKILVALRDPRDVVLSCFMQSFEPNEAMVNFNTLERTAAMYDLVMGGWLEQRATHAGNMLEYRYEDLVADTESTVAQVFAFLDVPWQASALDYRATQPKRHISTPSYQDVREAVYGRAVARWRSYATHLEPVLPVLEPYVRDFGYEPFDSNLAPRK